MTSFAARCLAILFTGMIGHHHATCCLTVNYLQPAPPAGPFSVMVVGECRVPHFHGRRAISGNDGAGPLLLTLCRASGAPDCCTLTGAFQNEAAPLTGTVQCKHQKRTRTFTLTPK